MNVKWGQRTIISNIREKCALTPIICSDPNYILNNMIFKKSPEKFWDLISAKYAASPISDRTAYETKIEKIKSSKYPSSPVERTIPGGSGVPH